MRRTKPTKRNASAGVLAFLLGFGLLALGFGSHSLYRYSEALRSESWPSTPASMTDWDVVVAKFRRGDRYTVRCNYRYQVDEIEYTGTKLRIAPGGNSLGREPEYANWLKER